MANSASQRRSVTAVLTSQTPSQLRLKTDAPPRCAPPDPLPPARGGPPDRLASPPWTIWPSYSFPAGVMEKT